MKLLKFLLVLSVPLIWACQSGETSNETNQAIVDSGIFERLNVRDFQVKLAANKSPQLIDVRTPEEYERGAINDAVNINFHDKDFLKNVEAYDKSQAVFIYCQAGGRSLKSAKKMQAAGFKEIYELKTGYSGWEH